MYVIYAHGPLSGVILYLQMVFGSHEPDKHEFNSLEMQGRQAIVCASEVKDSSHQQLVSNKQSYVLGRLFGRDTIHSVDQ
jgi:hypothetical protein